MLVYSYSEDTKEFIGVETAEQDREASLRLGKFEPLIPANATLLKPPTAGAGKVAVFENDKWVIKNDYRGQLVIDPKTDELQEIDYVGDIKIGFVFYSDYIKTAEYKEKVQKQKEARLQALAMKPLEFINAIETIGVSYTDLTSYCQENNEVDKCLKYSDFIARGDNFLNDLMQKFNITSEKMDKLFKDFGG